MTSKRNWFPFRVYAISLNLRVVLWPYPTVLSLVPSLEPVARPFGVGIVVVANPNLTLDQTLL